MSVMKLNSLALAALLTLGVPAFAHAQPQNDSGAKQDMKAAGHETKAAAKDAGHGVKQGTKKAYHKTKHGVKKTGHKIKSSTESSSQPQ